MAELKLKIENSRIGGVALLFILIVIDLVVITSLDLYIPALPQIRDEFGVTEAYLNMTIFVFMFCSAISVLVTAPISDRIGRKPSIILACFVFAVGSMIGFFAPNNEVLILCRVFQAYGMGSLSALITVVIQESFADESRKTAMTIGQSLILVGPFIAPFLGTFILSVASWRTIFLVLAVGGVISILLALLVPETRPKDLKKVKIASSVKYLLFNRKFVCLTLVLGISALPVFAFIGVFSYICLEFFSGDYLQYNILYSSITIVAIASPFLYNWMSKHMSNAAIYVVSFVLMGLSALLIPTIGYLGVFVLVAAYTPAEITEGIIRPISFIVLLDQKKENVAAASSITNCTYSLITAFGSVFATLPIWSDYIQAVGVICFCTLVLCVTLLIIGNGGIRFNIKKAKN